LRWAGLTDSRLVRRKLILRNLQETAYVKAIGARTGDVRRQTMLKSGSAKFVWTVGGELSAKGGGEFADYRDFFRTFDASTGKGLRKVDLGARVRGSPLFLLMEGKQSHRGRVLDVRVRRAWPIAGKHDVGTVPPKICRTRQTSPWCCCRLETQVRSLRTRFIYSEATLFAALRSSSKTPGTATSVRESARPVAAVFMCAADPFRTCHDRAQPRSAKIAHRLLQAHLAIKILNPLVAGALCV
jgi:hypothetical protein